MTQLLTLLYYKNAYLKLQFAVSAKAQKVKLNCGKTTLTDVELMNGYLQNVQNAAILFDCNHVRNVKIVFEISIFDQ